MKKDIMPSKVSSLLAPSKLSHLYASIIDQRKFSSLNTIMWDEFSMSGHYEIDGLDNFIAKDEDDYYKKALEFFEKPNKIEKIGEDLRKHALNSVIFDTKKFSKNFYDQLFQIYTSH